jgi:hypothetical protein
VCEVGEEGSGEEVGQSRLKWHADEDIAWFCAAIAPKSFTCSVPAYPEPRWLAQRSLECAGMAASRGAAMLVKSVFVALTTAICICGGGNM